MKQERKRVYISYNMLNRDEAEKICNVLEEKGIQCYLLGRDLQGNMDYMKEITAAVEQCDIFLPLISKYSHGSWNVSNEVGMALGKKKRIVCVLLDNSLLPHDLHKYPAIDLVNDNHQRIDCLVDVVKNELSKITPPIFLSHASVDYPRIEKFLTFLENKGLACWIAPRDIPYGSNYAREIPKVIEDCKCVIMFASPRSQMSEQVEKKMQIAVDFDKPIIPVRLEEFKFEGFCMYHLNNKQWFNAYSMTEEDLLKLERNLKELCAVEAVEAKPDKTSPCSLENKKNVSKDRGGSLSGSFHIADWFSGSCSMTIVMNILALVLVYIVFTNYSDVLLEQVNSLVQSIAGIVFD